MTIPSNAQPSGIGRTPAAFPRYMLDAVMERIARLVEESDGKHLLFFWSGRCLDYADRLWLEGEREPLIPTHQAAAMMLGPMEHYRRAHHLPRPDGTADDGDDADAPDIEWSVLSPTRDLPGVEDALSGFRKVVDNALHSTDWTHAALNLSVCASALAAFINCTDKDWLALSDENDDLAGQIRCYMENVARYADSPTAGIALGEIAKTVYEPDIQFYDPMNAAMLISSAAAFARHPDRVMWAYDVVDTAVEHFGETHDAELPHEALLASRRVLRRYLLMVAYDVRRLAEDDEGCRKLWHDHPDHASLTLMRALTLIERERYREAYDVVVGFVARRGSLREADGLIARNGLLKGILTHGWSSIMECCLEGMGDAPRLAALYRSYIERHADHGDDESASLYEDRLAALERWEASRDEPRTC